jgi:hypothetical protein
VSERLCNLFEICKTLEAPLCPIQETALKHAIWYPDEPICQSKQFQDLPWVKKQKQIAALRLKADAGFFTVRMLDTIHVVTKNLKGADPDDPNAELKWLKERAEKRATASQKRRRRKVVAKKKPAKEALFKLKMPKANVARRS